MQTITPTSAPLYEAIYVSTIAPEMPISSVANIAGKARTTNRRLGVTGL